MSNIILKTLLLVMRYLYTIFRNFIQPYLIRRVLLKVESELN